METASQFLKRAGWKLLMWMTEEIKMDKKKKTPKQIAALVCVGLLVLLLWIYMWLYGKMKDRFKEQDSEE